MSLFRARQWFSVQLGAGQEEFAHGCMVVANIDNAEDNAPKVVTGSLQGQLRIHCPLYQDQEARDALVLEVNLSLPILQLACGHFVPHANNQLALAVLHPHRLVVYTVLPAAATSSNDHHPSSQSMRSGGPLQLEVLHSYTLSSVSGRRVPNKDGDAASFSAANMCCGPFGGVSSDGSDGLCVQSMDGQLAVFEHGAHAFSRQLPSDKYLLPGPLCYVPKTDSFLTATAAGTVECYQYRALAEATADDVLDSRRSASAQGESATEVNDLLDSRGDSHSNSSAKTGSAGSSSSSDSEYLNGLMKGAKKSGSEREGKRLRAEWTAELGEQIFELKLGRVSSPCSASSLDVLVLGEKTLFALRDLDGRIRAQRTLAAPPSTLCLYARGGALEPCSGGTHPSQALADLPVQGHNVLLATFDKQLLVWAGGDQQPTQGIGGGGAQAAVGARSSARSARAGMGALVWSAQTDTSPVCLAVASFGTSNSNSTTPEGGGDGDSSNARDGFEFSSESRSSDAGTAPTGAATSDRGSGEKSTGARGLIVSLDDDGLLSLNYLGTDPPTSMVVAPSAFGELDYTQVEKEHQRLQKVIRAHASAQRQGSENGGDRNSASNRESNQVDSKSESKDEEKSTETNGTAAKKKENGGPKLLLYVACPLVADCGGISMSGNDQKNEAESGNWTYEDLNAAEEAAEAAGHGSNGVGLARFRGGGATNNNANGSNGAMSAVTASDESVAYADSSTADVWTDEVDENDGGGGAATSTSVGNTAPKDRGYAAVTLTIHMTCEGGLEMPHGAPITLQLPPWCICATPPSALVVPVPNSHDNAPTRRQIDSESSSSTSTATLQVRVLVLKGPLPDSVCGTAMCCYALPSTGEPRMATSPFVLPWTLAAQLASPNMAGLKGQCEFKLTLETNQPPTSLRHLFDDVLAHAQDCGALSAEADAAAATAMCFAYTGATVTGRSRISAQGSRNKEAHSFGPEDEDDDNEDQEGSTAAAGNEEGVDYDGDAELAWQASGLSSGAWDNAPVCATVLVSRSAGRYRVQAGSLAALWATVDALAYRLRVWFKANSDDSSSSSSGSSSNGGFVLSYGEDPPLPDFLACAERHLASRHALLDAHHALNDRAHQVRAVSKRLLVRFKDRNPAPLGRLDALASHSAQAARSVAQRVKTRQRQLGIHHNRLACSVGLLHLLICLRFQLSLEDAAELATLLLAPTGLGALPLEDAPTSSLRSRGNSSSSRSGSGSGASHAVGWVAPSAGDAHVQAGWHELVDLQLAHALRTSLTLSTSQGGKKANSSSRVAAPDVPAMPGDCSKLRRHLTLVCDRLFKGATFASV